MNSITLKYSIRNITKTVNELQAGNMISDQKNAYVHLDGRLVRDEVSLLCKPFTRVKRSECTAYNALCTEGPLAQELKQQVLYVLVFCEDPLVDQSFNQGLCLQTKAWESEPSNRVYPTLITRVESRPPFFQSLITRARGIHCTREPILSYNNI